MNTKEYLGNTIKTRRKEAKVEQSMLTDYADISLWTLSRIENGKANPSLEKLENILEVLGLELVLRKKSDGSIIERIVDEDR
jgi:transcriptional regulator with XRE-family HTH domain